MTTAPATLASASAIELAARSFVAARTDGRSLPGFPGAIPLTIGAAYAVQEAAIALYPDDIRGWKVGRVGPDFTARFAEDRLAGPIFSRSVWTSASSGVTETPIFVGGFAAVEAEFVFRLLEDAPRSKTEWTDAEAAALPHAMHIGIEMAGSPLATINALGPTVVAADFGNNNGLVLGPVMPGWADFAPEVLSCETFIDGQQVGSGSIADMPGGPLCALAFLLGHAASRGRPLKTGQVVSTGAITGIHDFAVGQNARVSFGRWGELEVLGVDARSRR